MNLFAMDDANHIAPYKSTITHRAVAVALLAAAVPLLAAAVPLLAAAVTLREVAGSMTGVEP